MNDMTSAVSAPMACRRIPSDTSPVLWPLLSELPPVRDTQCLADALEIFACHSAATAVTVLSAGMPIGLICRRMIADVVMLPCYRQSIVREDCTCFVSVTPTTIAHDAELAELARMLASRPEQEPQDPLVVTEGGRYLGLVDRAALARSVASMWPPTPEHG